MTTQRAVTLPTEKSNGDQPKATGKTASPGRGPRKDGSRTPPSR